MVGLSKRLSESYEKWLHEVSVLTFVFGGLDGYLNPHRSTGWYYPVVIIVTVATFVGSVYIGNRE
jgi:hypothetical protein